MASYVWALMMVMFASVSTQNLKGIPFMNPVMYRPSVSAPMASVLTEGKAGLSSDWSVGLRPLNSTVSRFLDVPAAVEMLASPMVYSTYPQGIYGHRLNTLVKSRSSWLLDQALDHCFKLI